MDDNTELYHYGVKGMKWGVRKDPDKRLNRQLDKENKRLDKATNKALKYSGKAQQFRDRADLATDRRSRDMFTGKANRLSRKAGLTLEKAMISDKTSPASDEAVALYRKHKAEHMKKVLTMNAATEARIDRYRSYGMSKTKSALRAHGEDALYKAKIGAALAVSAAPWLLVL